MVVLFNTAKGLFEMARNLNRTEVEEVDLMETAVLHEAEKDSRANRRSGKARDKRKAGWDDEDEDDGWN